MEMSGMMVACTCDPNMVRQRWEESWGLLTKHLSLLDKFQKKKKKLKERKRKEKIDSTQGTTPGVALHQCTHTELKAQDEKACKTVSQYVMRQEKRALLVKE